MALTFHKESRRADCSREARKQAGKQPAAQPETTPAVVKKRAA